MSTQENINPTKQDKMLKAHDPNSPSLAKLGDDEILTILEAVHDTHPASLGSIHLVCSHLNHLAGYISSKLLKLDLCSECGIKAEKTFRYLEDNDLLTAVRGIEITTSGDICLNCRSAAHSREMQRLMAGKKPRKGKHDASLDKQHEAILRLERLLPRMTGLRDLWWPDDNNIDVIMHALPPKVRLHARIEGKSRKTTNALLGKLRNNMNLHALKVQDTYHDATIRHRLMEPLKDLILSTPNLRSLTIDVGMPMSGCVISPRPREYCGMGFVDGEKLPSLEHLRIDRYPFGRTYEQLPINQTLPLSFQPPPYGQGYPGKGREQDHWAENFDWSCLKSLHTLDPDFALTLMPKLTSVEEVSITANNPDPTQRFYLQVPSILRKISIPNLHCTSLEGLTRHGSALRELEIHQREDGSEQWRQSAQLIVHALPELYDACPLIETLRLDIPRSGDWPYSTLDLLASFPRLRSLTIWFDLGSRSTLTEPKVTFSAVQTLSTYLHARNSKFRELRIYSGCHHSFGHGRPGPSTYWAQYNSSEFLCRLHERDDEAAKGVFVCECPALGEKANRALKGEDEEGGKRTWLGSLMTRKSSHDKLDYMRPRREEAFRVARDGPKSLQEWEAHH